MSEKPVPAPLERATTATAKPTEERLNQFVLRPEEFCWRDDPELSDGPEIKPLKSSIAVEGLQTPVEFYRDAQGQPILLKGHRRITAMRLLAQEGQPGFTADMLVPAIEVAGGTDEDYLVRSAVDNINRRDFSQQERLRLIKTLYHNHVPLEHIATIFGVDVKTIQRAVLLVSHDWMVQLVFDKCIPASKATRLLEVAVKENREPDLETDLKEWVPATQRKIQEKERLRKARDGKGLRPNELLVQTYVTNRLVDQWLSQLRKRERFASEAEWDFGAGVDPDTNKLQIEGIKVDLAKEPLTHLATVAAKLSKVSKDVLSYLKTRHALEAPEGPQDAIREESDQPLDLDLLRSQGLGDLAADLESRLLTEGTDVDDLDMLGGGEQTSPSNPPAPPVGT